jgi:hypothetical protein
MAGRPDRYRFGDGDRGGAARIVGRVLRRAPALRLKPAWGVVAAGTVFMHAFVRLGPYAAGATFAPSLMSGTDEGIVSLRLGLPLWSFAMVLTALFLAALVLAWRWLGGTRRQRAILVGVLFVIGSAGAAASIALDSLLFASPCRLARTRLAVSRRGAFAGARCCSLRKSRVRSRSASVPITRRDHREALRYRPGQFHHRQSRGELSLISSRVPKDRTIPSGQSKRSRLFRSSSHANHATMTCFSQSSQQRGMQCRIGG